MNDRALVLGIDGGGSRTRAVLARMDGTIVAAGQSGASNIRVCGVAGACRAIAEAAHAAAADGGLEPAALAGLERVQAGVAGAGAIADQQVLAVALSDALGLGPGRCRVDHDMRIAHEGAFEGGPGAVLIAGTGSVCFGRNADREARAGGFGPVLDDGGSGAWLGLEALRHMMRVFDGRARRSALAVAMEMRMGRCDAREILRLAEEGVKDRARLAELAPIVVASAESGDAPAVRIAADGSRELGAMVASVVTTTGSPEAGAAIDVAFCGGLLRGESWYRRLVAGAVAEIVPRARIVEPAMSAAAGAALLALRDAGVDVSGAVGARLRATDRQASEGR